MDDISSMLSSIMEDPKAMEQLKNTASMLFGQEGLPSDGGPAPARSSTSENPKKNDMDIFPVIAKLAPLLSSFGKEDESTRLLNSLRPFLGDERKGKLDEALRMMQVLKVIPLLKEQNIL